jgi:hypothetical protein
MKCQQHFPQSGTFDALRQEIKIDIQLTIEASRVLKSNVAGRIIGQQTMR